MNLCSLAVVGMTALSPYENIGHSISVEPKWALGRLLQDLPYSNDSGVVIVHQSIVQQT